MEKKLDFDTFRNDFHRLYGGRAFNKAFRLAAKAAEKWPERPEPQLLMGAALFRGKKFRELERLCAKAIVQFPSDPVFWELYGAASLLKGAWDEAGDRFEQALGLCNRDLGAYFRLGGYCLHAASSARGWKKTYLLETARGFFEYVLERQPNHAKVRQALATCLKMLDVEAKESAFFETVETATRTLNRRPRRTSTPFSSSRPQKAAVLPPSMAEACRSLKREWVTTQ